jgi:hypothetical protein
MILKEMHKLYESSTPIILILEGKDIKFFENALKKNKYKYKIGAS